jgi:PAS domain S-box-containing protein
MQLALNYANSSLTLANKLQQIEVQNDVNRILSKIYALQHDYKNAYKYHVEYKVLSDSIFKEENTKSIIEKEFTYKFDKEKQALELEQQKKDIVRHAEKKRQTLIIVVLLTGFLLISVFAGFVYRSYKAKHRTNLILTQQKAEIQELNEEYLALNEELMQSNEQLYHAKGIIQERENLLTQITDNVPVFISLVNNNFEYEFANNGYARAFRTNKEEILGQKVNNILDKETYDKAFPFLVRSMEGESASFENTLRYNDGQQRIIHTNYKPYSFRDGIKGVLVCSSDITERKKNEQALREMEEEKKRLMELEMERINRELETNQKSMTAATLKLIQNSERDTQTIEQLEEIAKNTTPAGKTAINNLIANYKRTSYNSNWEEFEILFEKVHSSFYENLSARYPDLTSNERKMCAFLKLNMSNKDIAQITFQSDDALKKARLRLRQKLEIDRETNLAAFMQGI